MTRIVNNILRTIALMLCVGQFVLQAWSQQPSVQDSLRGVIARGGRDTNTIKALNDYAMSVHETFPDTTRLFATKALGIADSLNYSTGRARSLNVIGVSYFIQNNYEKALEFYLQALTLRENAGDMGGVAALLNNVGMVYRDMKDYVTALSYYFRAKHLNDSLQNRLFLSRNLNNIGSAYEELAAYDSALVYHQRSLALKEIIGEKQGMATSLRNIGRVYLKLGRKSDAFEMLQKALSVPEISKQTMVQTLLDLSETYHSGKHEKAAISTAERAVLMSREMGAVLLEQNAHELLSRYKASVEDHRSALEHYQRFIAIRDSLFNDKSTRRLAALQTNYEIERQRNQIALLTNDKKLQETVRTALIGGAALLLILLLISFIAYRNKRRSEHQLQETNVEILRQQDLLSDQSQEIELVNTALSENNEQLAEANSSLTALNTEKDEFFGIVAHDLKNPLNGIRGLADMMLHYAGDFDESQKQQFLTSIVSASERMFELIKNLLDVNAIERGGFTLNPVVADVSTHAEIVADSYRTRAAQKQIVIHYAGEKGICATVDETALHQVLDNLVSNAVKYSPHGKHVWVVVSSHQSLVSSHQSLGIDRSTPNDQTPMTNDQAPITNNQPLMARVVVRDEGPGLNENDKQQLFGKFARLSAQPTGGEHSTGLGLSIVKKLVELMNGRVWCESELGQGATFIVELPTIQASEEK